MRKLTALLLAVLMLACCIGCGAEEKPDSDGRISIVTTIFPQYDFARRIVGDAADVSMLLSPGAESHSYEPSPKDIIAIQNCDLFIYVGGESDTWVRDILDSMGEKAPRALTLFECVETVEEQIVEGMEHDEEACDDPNHDHDEPELDEHVWTSPKNAALITERIAAILGELDAGNGESYAKNAAAYIEELDALDSMFEETMAAAARKCIVVGDRFPFRYMADAYDIEYYAAFPGCSDQSEPSAKTVAFLTDKVAEEGIPAVFHIEFSNHKVADAIAEATGAKVLLLHSCHNVTAEELESGVSYVSLMTQNAENLKEALS